MKRTLIKFTLRTLSALAIAAFCSLVSTSAMCDEADIIRITIDKPDTGTAPAGWEVKEWHGAAEIEVVENGKGNAIHLKSGPKTSTALFKDIKFDIKEYQYVTWRWKAVKLPPEADVRDTDKDDQAVQFYVVFPRFPAFANSRLVGYIWDTTAPVGTELNSTKTSTTRYIVLKSGEKNLGKWFEETRNVYEDYKRLFGEEPTEVGRVSVMIDSDDTKSDAESYVSGIYFSKTPPKAAPPKAAPAKEAVPAKDAVPPLDAPPPPAPATEKDSTSSKEAAPKIEQAPATETAPAKEAAPAK